MTRSGPAVGAARRKLEEHPRGFASIPSFSGTNRFAARSGERDPHVGSAVPPGGRRRGDSNDDADRVLFLDSVDELFLAVLGRGRRASTPRASSTTCCNLRWRPRLAPLMPPACGRRPGASTTAARERCRLGGFQHPNLNVSDPAVELRVRRVVAQQVIRRHVVDDALETGVEIVRVDDGRLAGALVSVRSVSTRSVTRLTFSTNGVTPGGLLGFGMGSLGQGLSVTRMPWASPDRN